MQVNIATKKVECTVQGVQPIPRGLAIEQACGQLLSTTGHLILPASHASLQIYDPLMDRHVASVQVGSRQIDVRMCADHLIVSGTEKRGASMCNAGAVGLSSEPTDGASIQLVKP